MKTIFVVMFALLLAGCAASQSPGCGRGPGLSAGCTEAENPVPYGD